MVAGSLAGAGCAYFLAPTEAASAQEAGASSEEQDQAYLGARLHIEAGNLDEARKLLQPFLGRKDCPDYMAVSAAELELKSASLEERVLSAPGATQTVPEIKAAREKVDKAYNAAREIVDDGLKRQPNSIPLLRLDARMQAYKGDFAAAIATLNAALKLAPGRGEILEELGDMHLKALHTVSTQEELQEQIRALVGVYEQILATRQGFDRLAPLLVLSSLYERLELYDKQLQVAQEAVDINAREVRCQMAVGRALGNLKRYDEALAVYREALLHDSDNPEVRAAIEETLGRRDDAAGRLAFYKQLGEDFPDDPQLQMLSAVSMFQAKDWEGGEARMQHFAAKWPEDRKTLAAARVEQATALRAAEMPDEALIAYRQALEADPENADARLQVEAILKERNDPAARVAFYDDLSARFPDDRSIQEMCAKAFFAAEDWATAERYLVKINEKWPDDAYAHIALVRTWLAMNKLDEAAKMARTMADRGEELAPGAIMAVVEKKIEANKAAEAADLLRVMIDKQPENMLVTILAVQTYAGLGDFTQAHEVLGKISGDLFEKHKADLLYMKAGLFQREGKMEDALTVMEGLIAEHADQSLYYRDSGIICQEMGSHEKAEAYYHKAVELDPKDAENYNTLGYFYAETNQKLDEALELVNKALELDPNAGHIIDSRGWVYYQRGEYELAVQDLKRAVELIEKPDAVIYEHLGDAQLKTGDVAGARAAWQRALELDAKQDDIRQKLQALPPGA